MQLQHRFTVPAPIETAWEALNDVEGVGACFPGATVTSVEGDEFAGTCKVKLGPISMQYSGSGRFLERDRIGHRAVLEAKGRDRRGNGTAAVTVTTTLAADGEDRTAVTVDTDLSITGKPAQFGRGVIQDVSDKLLGQFTDCLESRIGAADERGAVAESEPVTVPESGSDVAAQTAAQTGAQTAPGGAGTASARHAGAAGASGTEPPGPVASAGTSTETSLDLGATVLPVLARRYAPYAVGGLAVLLLLRRLLRR